MKEVIDLYAKMVIGIFAFIGPSFTLLIPLFYGPLQRAKVREERKKGVLSDLLQQAIQTGDGDGAESAKKAIKKYEQDKANTQKEINLLSPKRQVKRLFGGLGFALFFLGTLLYQYSEIWISNITWSSTYKFIFKLLSLGLSMVGFGYALYVLAQLFSTIIKSKEEDEQVKNLQKSAVEPVNEGGANDNI